jgi:potassium efflux system protein
MAGEMSLEELKRIRGVVEASQELGDSVKKSVLSLVDQAIFFLGLADQYNSRTEEIGQKAKAAPDRLKKMQTQLDRPVPSAESVRDDASKMESDQLEQRRRQEEADLAKAKTTLSNLTEQLNKQKNSPQKLREGVAKAKQRLDELGEELKATSPPDEAPEVTKARRVMLQAEQAKEQAEIASSEKELAQNNVLVSLLTAERDLAILEVRWREELTKAWQAQAQERRQLEAERARVKAEQAKEEAYDLPPALQKQFDINIQRGEELEKLTRDEVQVKKKLLTKQIQLKDLKEEFSLARERVTATVLTEAIALALRQQRQSLPSFRNYRRDSGQRQLTMSEIRETQFEIDRERRELADMSDDTDEIIQSLGPLYGGDATRLRGEVEKLLGERRALLEKLQAGYRRYFRNLQDLEFTEQQLATTAEQYADFLDERLIWIRSSKVIGLGDLRKMFGALGWVASPSHWWHVLEDTWESFGHRPMVWLMGLLFGGALLRGRRWVRRELTQIAERVGDVQRDSFVLTLQALVMTLCLTVSGPFLVAFVGWRLHRLPFAYDFTQAASNGLMEAALVWVTFGLFYQICAKDGLAQAVA